MKQNYRIICAFLLAICMLYASNLIGQVSVPDGMLKNHRISKHAVLNKADQTQAGSDIIVYETALPLDFVGIQGQNILAQEVSLANPGKTNITKIRVAFDIYLSQPQQVKLWIFDALNSPAIYTQNVGEYSFINADNIMIGMVKPVHVPQHFYVGFSIQRNDSSNYDYTDIGVTGTVLTGQATDSTYYYGTVSGGVLDSTWIPTAPWQRGTMVLNVYTDSVNTVIPRFSSNVQYGEIPLPVQFKDESSSSINDPITAWEWSFGDGYTSGDRNPYHIYTAPGVYDVSLTVATADTEMTRTEKMCINAYDKDRSLSFNGANWYWGYGPETLADSSLDLTDKFTMEAWIYPYGWGNTRYAITNNIDTDLRAGYARIISAGLFENFAVYLHNAGNYGYTKNSLCASFSNQDGNINIQNTPQNSIVLNKWQHIAVTYDAETSTCKIYIDSTEQTLQSFGDTLSGPLADYRGFPVVVGNNLNMSRSFDGRIDEMRIWNYVRTADQIQSSMNRSVADNASGLVAYWTFDEGEGLVVHDQSGNGHDLSMWSYLPPIWSEGAGVDPVTSVESRGNVLPNKFVLSQNYPNPFNPTTTISYSIPKTSFVKLKIYDILGREVETLVNEEKSSGNYKVQFNGSSLSSGVYFYKMEAGAFIQTKKLLLIK